MEQVQRLGPDILRTRDIGARDLITIFNSLSSSISTAHCTSSGSSAAKMAGKEDVYCTVSLSSQQSRESYS